MHKKFKVGIVLGMICLMLFSTTCFAASYNFSFMTSSPSVGGSASKKGKSAKLLVLLPTASNCSCTRYINAWGAKSNSNNDKITEVGTLASTNNLYLSYTSSGKSYIGKVNVWGNPSIIGASSHGSFTLDE